MNEPEFDKDLEHRLKASADELDGATRSRLNQARQRALDELPRSRARRWPLTWAPVTAAAAAGVVAVYVWQSNVPDNGAALPTDFTVEVSDDSANFEMELLLNDADLEMFEDLEFYAALTDAELEATG